MRLVLFCLFALCCCSLANATRNRRNLVNRKLHEVLRQLKGVKQSLQHSTQMLYTPPENIEDCCCLSALECFRVNLHLQFNMTQKNPLYRSLNSPTTIDGLKFCNPGNATSVCKDCTSHPKESAPVFFSRLESLIQMALSRRTMN